jgi:hypothetical protein
MSNLNRRDFLKGAGIGALGALSAGALTACSPGSVSGENGSSRQDVSANGNTNATATNIDGRIAPGYSNPDGIGILVTPDSTEEAATGTEDEFGKPAEYIWPLQVAPFYAVKAGVNTYNTNGGIRINRQAQVIDPKGKPIMGLYASGIATAGWDSQTYGGGTNQPVALWCSCAAARHLVVSRLGGTVDPKWMGDAHVTDLYAEFQSTDTAGNPLG